MSFYTKSTGSARKEVLRPLVGSGSRAKEVPKVEFVAGRISGLMGWLLRHVNSSGSNRVYELAEDDGIVVMYGLKSGFIDYNQACGLLLSGQGSGRVLLAWEGHFQL